MKSILTTLCYIEQNNCYLMLHRTKKEVDINKDKWIGVGGHFEKNESPDDCLKREVMEETGLELSSYNLRGIITFDFTPLGANNLPIDNERMTEYMFLYTASVPSNVFSICDEGDLEWVDKSKIDTLNLWEGDKIFFRLLEERQSVFSLKLVYHGSTLTDAVLDGTPMKSVEGKS